MCSKIPCVVLLKYCVYAVNTYVCMDMVDHVMMQGMVTLHMQFALRSLWENAETESTSCCILSVRSLFLLSSSRQDIGAISVQGSMCFYQPL